MQSIELISFKLCPFVQRSVITLLKKEVKFKITYIDLDNKPEWFLKISPLGKVPLVKYGDEVLFESAVINEFLDEITAHPIMPVDPLKKAKDRAWIEFVSQLIMNMHNMLMSKTQQDFEANSAIVNKKLAQLEGVVIGGYFSSDQFSLVDAAIAPILLRLALLKQRYAVEFLTGLPKLMALSDKLLDLDCVKRSVVDDYSELLGERLLKWQSYLAVNTLQNDSQQV
ncbi:MAG: glutathione S-transferase family protein [Oceanospirillaceae bacterium]